MKLSYDNVKRFVAHINLKKVGAYGQKKIIDSNILIIGLGGLGSPIALYLAAAGIKNIGIVDNDTIDISNLHRQILFTEKDIGKPKVEITNNKLKQINSKINVKKFFTKIHITNIQKIIKKFNIIIDGTDNFNSKLLINDFCKKNKKILISGAISKFLGQIFVFDFKKKNSPCLRCFMPDKPETEEQNCQSEGILGTLAGITGTIMANETIKEILNFKSLCGYILMINSQDFSIKKIKLTKNKYCSKKHGKI